MSIDAHMTPAFSPAALRETYRQLLIYITAWSPIWPEADTEALNVLAARWGIPPEREDDVEWTHELLVVWATVELERLATLPPSPV